jgi:glycogenin glucosyltransferase
VQNPEEKLDQLRRSSVIEFEHLRKDEHPNPPLRALPEYSAIEAKDERIAHVPLSGGSSPHGLQQPMGLDGANDQAIPGSFSNIADKDFASNEPAPDVRTGSGDRSFAHGDKSVAPQHYSSQDFSKGGSSTVGQGFSSLTSQQATSPDQTAGHHSLSGGHKIQAPSGNMTFTVPSFDNSGSSDAKAEGHELSPTTTRT